MSLEIQSHRTYDPSASRVYHSVYALWDQLPKDRKPYTNGYTEVFSAQTGVTSPKLCKLVWLMMPEEHFSMQYGQDRLDDRNLWEARAKVVEHAIVRKLFPDYDRTIEANYYYSAWSESPPNDNVRSLTLHPYGHSILLFQEPGGNYQCFLPESVYLAQHKDLECVTRYYSSCQGVELKLVWGMHFLSHEHEGVQV